MSERLRNVGVCSFFSHFLSLIRGAHKNSTGPLPSPGSNSGPSWGSANHSAISRLCLHASLLRWTVHRYTTLTHWVKSEKCHGCFRRINTAYANVCTDPGAAATEKPPLYRSFWWSVEQNIEFCSQFEPPGQALCLLHCLFSTLTGLSDL